MKNKKIIQQFVNRHFSTIKFILLLFIAVLLVYGMAFQINQAAEQNERAIIQAELRAEEARARDEAIEGVINTIRTENEMQTIIINRQFRALCILIVDISGEAGLQRLDAESRQRCGELDKEVEDEVQ